MIGTKTVNRKLSDSGTECCGCGRQAFNGSRKQRSRSRCCNQVQWNSQTRQGRGFCCRAANALNTPQSHFGVKLGFAAKKCCKWEWTRGNLRGGFLICENNQGREVVKKIHLGLASSGYCPCPHRATSVSSPCPLPAPTLGGSWLGRGFSILRKVSVKDDLGQGLVPDPN